jgi:ubiquinone/menaquinone biosynthesis C-methylase UbiE
MNKTDKSYKFWDRVSGWSKAESAANSTLVKYLNSKFGIHIMPDDTILDYGCGTGTITLQIARNANKVYGIDVSEGMLKRAQQNLINQNIANTTFTKITALDKMFQEDSFQVITTFNVFQYIENREELFPGLAIRTHFPHYW